MLTTVLEPVLAQTSLGDTQLSALARENLTKPRAKAPFDLTGTWRIQYDPKFLASSPRFVFNPVPKFTPAAQLQVNKHDEYAAKGLQYRDDAGACWPVGMPKMLNRLWPIQIVQLPTMIIMISMFNNSVRWIYTDGRSHPSADQLLPSYNGHSIGHWDKDTLIVDTTGIADDHHWVDEGVPGGPMLHIVERIRLTDGGKVFENQITMSDPDNWEGPWTSSLRFGREDRMDIEEGVCIYEQMRELPSFKFNVRE